MSRAPKVSPFGKVRVPAWILLFFRHWSLEYRFYTILIVIATYILEKKRTGRRKNIKGMKFRSTMHDVELCKFPLMISKNSISLVPRTQRLQNSVRLSYFFSLCNLPTFWPLIMNKKFYQAKQRIRSKPSFSQPWIVHKLYRFWAYRKAINIFSGNLRCDNQNS